MSETPSTDVSLSDEIAEESGDAATTIERPSGAPQLWPFLKLPRRKRAEFFKQLENLPTDEKGELEIDTTTMTMTQAANAFGLLADVEDALREVAPDTKAFNTWALECSDEDMLQLFGWYMQRYQPGEASASPTS